MIVIHHSHVDMAARSLILHLAHVQARMAREMITARALDSREYRVRKGHGPMTCMFCRSSVLSKAHKDQCIEVRMYENRSLQRPLRKGLMTYGLGGCTALLIVKTETILLAHHPDTDIIRNIISQESRNPNAFFYVRTPGAWVKNTCEKYDLIANATFPDYVVVEAYTTVKDIDEPDWYRCVYVREDDGKVNYMDLDHEWQLTTLCEKASDGAVWDHSSAANEQEHGVSWATSETGTGA